MPSVVAVDSSMSEDQIKDVFTSNFLTHADQLATLNATSITIPEITLIFTVEGTGGGTSTVTYRDIVLTNVKDGLAETLSIGSGESVSQGETTTYKALSANAFDLKRLLEFTGIVKGDPSAPLKPIYTSFTGDGSTQGGPLYSCTFGGSSSGTLEARPVRVTLSEVMAVIEKFKGADEPPPEALDVIVGYGVDLLRAFRGGAGTVGAIDCTVPGETPVSIKIAGASTGDFESGVYPRDQGQWHRRRCRRLSATARWANSCSSRSTSIPRSMRSMPPTVSSTKPGSTTNWRQLIPSWDGLSLRQFRDRRHQSRYAGRPLDGHAGAASEHIEAKVANFDLSLANYFLGIPTDVSMSASGIEVPLPQDIDRSADHDAPRRWPHRRQYGL